MNQLFLTPEQLQDLTGYKQSKKQIEVLQQQHLPFMVNRNGRPIVTVSAVGAYINTKAESQPTATKKTWKSTRASQ